MSDNLVKPIMIAVSIFITCLVISMAVYLGSVSTKAGSGFGTRLSRINKSISEGDVLMYDTDNLSGSDVISCINKYKDDVTVKVTKIIGVDGRTFVTEYSKATGRFNNTPNNVLSYINPNAEFDGVVSRNPNGVITEIAFSQCVYVADAGPNGSGNVVGTTPPADPGGSEISAATITALINSLETTRTRIEDQIVLQTQTINGLLEKFADLQREFNDLTESGVVGGGSGGDGSGSTDNTSDLSTVVSDLADSVKVMSNTLDSLVSRFDIIAQAVAELNTKIDGLSGTGSGSGGSGSGGTGDPDTGVVDTDTTDYTQIRADIDALQYNISSINTQLDTLSSTAVTDENVENLRNLTAQLQSETVSAIGVTNALLSQLEGNTSTTASDLRDNLNGISSLLATISSELDRISTTLNNR